METKRIVNRLDQSFKLFYELMARRVSEILLVSSPYDAFIMEEDGRLAGRIIHEYQGLNLTRPPRISWVSSAREALAALKEKPFDLVITMPRLDDMEPALMCSEIKQDFPDLPVYYLAHDTSRYLIEPAEAACGNIDRRWWGHIEVGQGIAGF